MKMSQPRRQMAPNGSSLVMICQTPKRRVASKIRAQSASSLDEEVSVARLSSFGVPLADSIELRLVGQNLPHARVRRVIDVG